MNKLVSTRNISSVHDRGGNNDRRNRTYFEPNKSNFSISNMMMRDIKRVEEYNEVSKETIEESDHIVQEEMVDSNNHNNIYDDSNNQN